MSDALSASTDTVSLVPRRGDCRNGCDGSNATGNIYKRIGCGGDAGRERWSSSSSSSGSSAIVAVGVVVTAVVVVVVGIILEVVMV